VILGLLFHVFTDDTALHGSKLRERKERTPKGRKIAIADMQSEK
jgi:hypothetical protein